MIEKGKVTARELNQAANDLKEQGGYAELVKHYSKLSVTVATKNKGVCFMKIDNPIYKMIVQSRKTLQEV